MRSRSYAMAAMAAVMCCVGCSSSTGGRPPDALATAAQPAGEPTVPEGSEPLLNRLKWSTATEVDNFGFDIYRATSEDGPFDRITSTPIPGAGTVDEPRYYEYEDEAIDPTRDYYYYVESISIDGMREQFSPIIKAKAKRPVNE